MDVCGLLRWTGLEKDGVLLGTNSLRGRNQHFSLPKTSVWFLSVFRVVC